MRSRRASVVLAISVVAGLLTPWSGGAAGATSEQASATGCAGSLSFHSQAYLTGFEGLNPATKFYAGIEGGTSEAMLTVTLAETCSQPPDDFAQPGQAFYSTVGDGSAIAEDYQAIPKSLSAEMCVQAGPPPHDPCPLDTVSEQDVPLGLLSDTGDDEDAVESFTFKLDPAPSGPPLSATRPTQATVHVIDADGIARVSLEPTLDGLETIEYEAPEQSSHFHIPVFWAGPTDPTESVPFEIGNVPGYPQPTLGVDYRLNSPSPLQASDFIYGEDRVAFIKLQILNDNREELDEAFSITLTSAKAVAGRNSTTVTIPDAGVDTLAPRTDFHHPKHKKRYAWNAFQLREMHIFYREEQGGSGIQRAQIAISRKKSNGQCQWWNGKRFQGGDCGGVPGSSWKRTKYDRSLDWFLYRVPAFKPTQGTNIRFYRAFARGFDLAGNVETQLQVGRNKNTFRIKRR